MKNCALFFIVLISLAGTAAADNLADVNGQPAPDSLPQQDKQLNHDNTAENGNPDEFKSSLQQRPREGSIIWLEKKIAPSTRWIENLVKPLNIWMERKIQSSDDVPPTPPTNTWIEPPAKDNEPSLQQGPLLTAEQAATTATAAVQGEVLRVKLLRNHTIPRYRVKLISTSGEIHILYINARTGEFIQPTTRPANQ